MTFDKIKLIYLCEFHINDYDNNIFFIANFVTSFITAVQNKEPNFNLNNSRLRLVSGTSNPKLALEIASYLGIENVPLISKRFADGELYVQIQQSIRGCDVFLIPVSYTHLTLPTICSV